MGALNDDDDIFGGDKPGVTLIVERETAPNQPAGSWRDVPPNVIAVEEHPSITVEGRQIGRAHV